MSNGSESGGIAESGGLLSNRLPRFENAILVAENGFSMSPVGICVSSPEKPSVDNDVFEPWPPLHGVSIDAASVVLLSITLPPLAELLVEDTEEAMPESRLASSDK